MVCTKCGASMEPDAAFCSACGTQVIRVQPMPSVSWKPPEVETDAPYNAASDAPYDEEPNRGESPQQWRGEDEIAERRVAAPVARVMPYAGFWLRAVAFMVDSLLLCAMATPLLILIVPQTGPEWEQYSKLSPQEMINLSNPAVRPIMLIVFPAVFILGWLYYALCESSQFQGTLGKKLLGLRVTGLDGRPVSFTRASARFFARILTGLVPFGIGYLLAGFTQRKQALHDIIASCLVLRRAGT